MKKRNQKGVIVRFELLDNDDNIVNVIAEQTFPSLSVSSMQHSYSFSIYCCILES